MPIPTEITLRLYPEIPLRRGSSDVCTNIRTVLATKQSLSYAATIPAIEPRSELLLTVPATYVTPSGQIRFTSDCTYAALGGMGSNAQGLDEWLYFVEYVPDDIANTGDTTVLRLALDAWSTLTRPSTETVPTAPMRELLRLSSATLSLGHDARGVAIASGTDASRMWIQPPTRIGEDEGVVLIAAYSIKETGATGMLVPALVQVHGAGEADARIRTSAQLSAAIHKATVTIPEGGTEVGIAALLDMWIVPWSARPNGAYLRTLYNGDAVLGSLIGYKLAAFSYHSTYGARTHVAANRTHPVRYGNGDVSVEIPAHSSRAWDFSTRVVYNSANASLRAFIVGAGGDVEVTDSLSVPFSTLADPNQRREARIQDVLTGIATAAGLAAGVATLNPFAILTGVQGAVSLAADVIARVYVNRREIAGGGIANTMEADGYANPSATFRDVIRAERLHPDNTDEIANAWRIYGFSGARQLLDYHLFALPAYAFYAIENASFPAQTAAPWLLEMLRDRLREGVRVWNTEQNADRLLDWTQDPTAAGLIG